MTTAQEQHVLTVALAGNPNSGKSTLFNALTKLRQKVGNYPGVTVEKRTGRFDLDNGSHVNVLDLPGTYSLTVQSPDEQVAHDVLLGRITSTPQPDIVVCVVDACHLERHLYLVSQIQDLRLPVIVALNMMDELTKQGRTIDINELACKLGSPVVPMSALHHQGLNQLKDTITRGCPNVPARRWRLPKPMERAIQSLQHQLETQHRIQRNESFSRGLLYLTTDTPPETLPKDLLKPIAQHRATLEAQGIHWRSAAVAARYTWIQQVLVGIIHAPSVCKPQWSDKLDAILTHKIWGWVAFLGMMTLMFYTIFTVAAIPMDWIDGGFTFLSEQLHAHMPPGDLRDLVTNGIVAGIGGVMVFLPQILILFFFICLLQDSGYMARAAFIMDRLMSRVGLHGKAFIPLLSSFACAIPGIMATRSIESPKDRMVTLLVAPLMTCSARLPVFTLLIATLLPNTPALTKAGLMLLMYLLGTIGAIGMAWLFKRTLFKGPTPPFIMELPPYRLPSAGSILLHMWERSYLFIKKAGTIIFAFSVILWALMTYPKADHLSPDTALKQSFAGRLGVAMEPAIRPLGYDWRIGIGLLGSMTAREIFVSTMNIVFSLDKEADTLTLREAFSQADWPDGRPLFTPLTCLSLMVFYVFAMQCVSSLAVIRRETNSWRWPLFQLVYMTTLAYVAALLVYQGGHLLGGS